jgi:general stress protein 26
MNEPSDHVQHLEHQDAIEKMKEIVEHTNICLFTTHLEEAPLPTRPMATQKVDEEGNFWFLSDAASRKNFEVKSDSRIQLFYANPSKYEFMTVYGHAVEYKDRQIVEDLWTPVAKAWFKEGKDDPSLTAIMVIPDEAYYWDTKSSKMVALVKILASMVSDRTMDDGVEGKLKV